MAKMKDVGFNRFALGLSGNLIPFAGKTMSFGREIREVPIRRTVLPVFHFMRMVE